MNSADDTDIFSLVTKQKTPGSSHGEGRHTVPVEVPLFFLCIGKVKCHKDSRPYILNNRCCIYSNRNF